MNSNKKRLLNIALSLGLAAIPFAVLSEQGVKAANTQTTASIAFSLLDDDKKTFVSSTKVVVTNLSSQTGASTVDYTTTWGFDGVTGDSASRGTLTKTGLNPGKYAITAQVDGASSPTTVTTFVDVKASTAATKVSAIALPTSAKVDKKKSGKISATVAALANANIIIKNTTTAWKTTADGNGHFEVFVPAGSYDIIVDTDKDISISGLKNTSYFVNVQAGQNNLPFDDMVADSGENDALGFDPTDSSITPDSKEYKGKANLGTTVRAYTVNDQNDSNLTNDVYTLIGETVTKKGKSATVGDFSIKLAKAQPNQRIHFVVEDTALNTYSSDVYQMGTVDPAFKADSNAKSGKDVNLTFTDKSGLLATANDLTVKLKKSSELDTAYITLTKDTEYKITNGKLTISSQAFLAKNPTGSNSDTAFTISVTATGFVNSTIPQTVKAVTSPSLSVSVSKATSEGIKVAATATKNTMNKIYYTISGTEVTVPKLYSVVNPATFTELKTSPTDNITTNVAANKYLVVYELDSANRVVKFKQTKLTSSQIQVATANVGFTLKTPTPSTNNKLVGGNAIKTVTVSVVNNTNSIVITGTKAATQTVTRGGANAASVTLTGATGTGTALTYTVDTKNIASKGGKKIFTLTVSEKGKGSIVYNVTVIVAAP